MFDKFCKAVNEKRNGLFISRTKQLSEIIGEVNNRPVPSDRAGDDIVWIHLALRFSNGRYGPVLSVGRMLE